MKGSPWVPQPGVVSTEIYSKIKLKEEKDVEPSPGSLFQTEEYKKKYADKNKVPRPNNWSGWNLSPSSIEFWLDGDNRIHERLKYIKNLKGEWIRSLLSP